MSSASIQKLFCGIHSTFKCSFDEFVGEKVFSPSYSSAILAPPLTFSHSEGSLFTLLTVSFVVQKLLILINTVQFIFSTMEELAMHGHGIKLSGAIYG